MRGAAVSGGSANSERRPSISMARYLLVHPVQ
jgi:hypothetical protein